MNNLYFTITATDFFYGQKFFAPDMKVRLRKEHDNQFDREAIKVELNCVGQIGYVANSPRTVIGESYSAGRLYDKIGETAEATVLYVLDKGVLCSVASEKEPLQVRYVGEDFGMAGLRNGKIYDCLGVEDGQLRIIDESGDDYLYSAANPAPLCGNSPGGRWEIVADDAGGTLREALATASDASAPRNLD